MGGFKHVRAMESDQPGIASPHTRGGFKFFLAVACIGDMV